MPPKELGALEIFFDTKWNNFVRKYRWIFIIFGFCLPAYAGYRSMEIKGLSAMEAFFTKDHYLS
jgi:hypothetical protein